MQPSNQGYGTERILAIIGGIVVVFCGGFCLLGNLMRIGRDLFGHNNEVSPAEAQQLANTISDVTTAMPEIQADPKWDGDQLKLKLTFSSAKETYKGIAVSELLLDNYVPGLKLPKKIDAFSPGHPSTLVVEFPGFDGRGGKYAKLHVSYESTDPNKMFDDSLPLVEGGAPVKMRPGKWTSGTDPDIYIPLRGKAKAHA